MSERLAGRPSVGELEAFTRTCQEQILERAKAGKKLPFGKTEMAIWYYEGEVKTEEELGDAPKTYCWYVSQDDEKGQLVSLSSQEWQNIRQKLPMSATEIPTTVGEEYLGREQAFEFFKLAAGQGRIINAWNFSLNSVKSKEPVVISKQPAGLKERHGLIIDLNESKICLWPNYNITFSVGGKKVQTVTTLVPEGGAELIGEDNIKLMMDAAISRANEGEKRPFTGNELWYLVKTDDGGLQYYWLQPRLKFSIGETLYCILGISGADWKRLQVYSQIQDPRALAKLSPDPFTISQPLTEAELRRETGKLADSGKIIEIKNPLCLTRPELALLTLQELRRT